MSIITIFTDGSSLIKDNFYESSSAIIVYRNYQEIYRGGTYHPDGTNSKGEVYAMKMAYDKLYELFTIDEIKDSKISIISDSDYVVSSVTKWIYNWAKNGWLNSNGEKIKFKSTFKYLYEKYLDRSIKNKKIKVFHIKSHISNIPKARRKFQVRNDVDITNEEFDFLVRGNVEVDELANEIRINKTEDYESLDRVTEVDSTWGSLQRRDGRIVIKTRLR